MWFMTRAGPQFNLIALLCFFGIFIGALFTRDQILLAAFGLPAGLFFFISIFTHALTRYNVADDAVRGCFRPLAVRRAGAPSLSPIPSFPDSRRPMPAAHSAGERCEKLEPAAPDHADIERRDRFPRLSGKLLAQGFVGHHALKLCRQRRHVSRLDQQAIFAAFEDLGRGAWAIGSDHGAARSQRLEQHIGIALIARRQHEQVGRGERRAHILAEARKRDPIAKR